MGTAHHRRYPLIDNDKARIFQLITMASDTLEDFVIVDREEVPRLTSSSHLQSISRAVDDIADELWLVNKKIHDNPELGYEEFIAHSTLIDFMSQQCWTVQPSAYGMATAWVATYDSGKSGPVVSFNVEMGTFTCIPYAL